MRTAIRCKFKTALLATVSASVVIAGSASAQAPVEEVIVTGSLIRGGSVVGVPVTTLGQDDFQKTGAITVTDLLKSVPGVFVSPSLSPSGPPGNFVRTASMDIHQLNPANNSQRTLTLIDGVRYAYSGQNGEKGDLSFLPQLALARLDVLATGASATYGSDAIAGVINAVLRRNFDGAITQVQAGTPEGGGFHWAASALYGRSWETGNITLAFTHRDVHRLAASERPDLFTADFRPWGLDNRTAVRSSVPGVVSVVLGSPIPLPATAAPNVTIGTGCTNCFSIPKGSTGIGLTWATLAANAGVANEVSPFRLGDALPPEQGNALSAVFDQDLWPGVHLFGSAYYSNRRGVETSPTTVGQASGNTVVQMTVPSSNPFYPTGALPAGVNANAATSLAVSYDFSNELLPLSSFFEVNGRYSLGVDFELPRDWKGRVQATQSAVNNGFTFMNFPNTNNLSAALGNTVTIAASGSIPAITIVKPATIPHYNPFCDPTGVPQYTCNSKATLDYITGFRTNGAHQIVNELDVNFDGKVLTLPGGDLRLAIGGSLLRTNIYLSTLSSLVGTAASLPILTTQTGEKNSYALFAEASIPLVGEANAFPLVQKLDLQVSHRYDHYDQFGPTSNPRVAVNWMPIDDLTLKGSWGTSFRTPGFVDVLQPAIIRPIGAIIGGLTSFSTCAAAGGTPVPGSIGQVLNPTCSGAAAFLNPGGIAPEGSVDLEGIFNRSLASPEKSKDYSFGFRYTATDNFLSGLDVEVTYWHIKIDGLINSFRTQSSTIPLRDLAFSSFFTVPSDAPGLAAALAAGSKVNVISPADFADKVNTLINSPRVNLPFAAGAASNVKYLWDGLTRNMGSLESDGIDFNVNYDWAGGDLGDWNAGVAGTYYLHRETVTVDGLPAVDVFETAGPEFVPDPGVFGTVLITAPGQTQAVRMRYRGRIGWSMDDLSITAFVNYRSHHFTTSAVMPSAAVLSASGITNFSNFVPSYYTFDLAMSYNLADRPANDYLKNIQFGLVVANILDRKPPFTYQASAFGSGVAAFNATVDSPLGRDFTFTITKTW